MSLIYVLGPCGTPCSPCGGGGAGDDGTWHLRIFNSNGIGDDSQNIYIDGVFVALYTGDPDFDNNFPLSRPSAGDHLFTFTLVSSNGLANLFELQIVRESNNFVASDTTVLGYAPSDYSPTAFSIA